MFALSNGLAKFQCSISTETVEVYSVQSQNATAETTRLTVHRKTLLRYPHSPKGCCAAGSVPLEANSKDRSARTKRNARALHYTETAAWPIVLDSAGNSLISELPGNVKGT